MCGCDTAVTAGAAAAPVTLSQDGCFPIVMLNSGSAVLTHLYTSLSTSFPLPLLPSSFLLYLCLPILSNFHVLLCWAKGIVLYLNKAILSPRGFYVLLIIWPCDCQIQLFWERFWSCGQGDEVSPCVSSPMGTRPVPSVLTLCFSCLLPSSPQSWAFTKNSWQGCQGFTVFRHSFDYEFILLQNWQKWLCMATL